MGVIIPPPKGSGVSHYLIAASNAPQNVKNRADFVCPGIADDVYILSIINSLPLTPAGAIRAGFALQQGPRGHLAFSEGIFNFANKLTIPAGASITIQGAGCSGWQPYINNVVPGKYEDGTLFYSTDPTGAILDVPVSTNGYPQVTLYIRDLMMMGLNPAAHNTVSMFDLSGWMCGDMINVNVVADLTVNPSPNIGYGVNLLNGASHDMTIVRNCKVFGAYYGAWRQSNTHCFVSGLDCGYTGSYATAAAFSLQGNNNNHWEGLHAFGGSYGIVTIYSSLILEVDSIHLEGIAHPLYFNSAAPVHIRRAELDLSVPFSGDVADPTKCMIDQIWYLTAGYSLLSQNRGTGNITSGTSVVVNHGLMAAPTGVQVTPEANQTLWVTSVGSTSFTVNCTTGTPSFYWEARV